MREGRRYCFFLYTQILSTFFYRKGLFRNENVLFPLRAYRGHVGGISGAIRHLEHFALFRQGAFFALKCVKIDMFANKFAYIEKNY